MTEPTPNGISPNSSNGAALTDAELIELVQQKTPEELTEAEIELLRSRLAVSSELQEVLLNQLHFEGYLNAVLSPMSISPEAIIESAESSSANGKRSLWRWFSLLTLLLAIGGGLGLWVVNSSETPEERIADADPIEDFDSPPDEPPTDPETKTDVDVPGAPVAILDPMPMDIDAATKPDENTDPDPQPEREPNIWDAAFDPETQPVAFVDAAVPNEAVQRFASFPGELFREWFGPVPGQPFSVKDQDWYGQRKYTRFEGVTRLKAPWIEDAVFEFSPYEPDLWHLHVLTETGGILLAWHNRSHVQHWAAYETEPGEDPRKPRIVRLLTSDDGRHERSRFGPFQMRHQNGSLILTRGDLRLLSVPCPSRPRDLQMFGRVSLAAFRVFRGEAAMPVEPLTEPQGVAYRPADLKWNVNTPDGVRIERDDAGGVLLASEVWTESATIFAPVPTRGFTEFEVVLETPTTGTAFFLGDADGQPLRMLGVFEDRSAKYRVLSSLNDGQTHREVDYPDNSGMIPVIDSRVHLRILSGLNSTEVLISADGQHWGRAFPEPLRSDSVAEMKTIGLRLHPHDGERAIRLEQVIVKPLTALDLIADSELQQVAGERELLQAANIELWLADVVRQSPVDGSQDEWRRAAALTTMLKGRRDLSRSLYQMLLSEVPELDAEPEAIFACLHALARIGQNWEGGERDLVFDAFEKTAIRFEREGRGRQLLPTLRHRIVSRLWTHDDPDVLPKHLLRESLQRSLHRREFGHVTRAVRMLQFLTLPSHPHRRHEYLKDADEKFEVWAYVTAGRGQRLELDDLAASLESRWKHPIVSELSKEGYNVMAEFEAAIAANALEEACSIIGEARLRGLDGMLPDSEDESLDRSLRNAVATAMRDRPELLATMRSTQGPLAMLRVREAMREGDENGVRALTLRYYGTEAAVLAHGWLGDRAVSRGELALAIQRYRDALSVAESLPNAETIQIPELLGKLRLAAALQGREEGEPATQPIGIGDASYSPNEFETLTASLRDSRGSGTLEVSGSQNANATPPAGVYRWEKVSSFDGEAGQKPAYSTFRYSDWTGKQIGFATDEKRLYLSNRVQVAAFDGESGKRLWTRTLGGEAGGANAWPFTRATPLPIGDRLFIRRLTKDGFELACLSAKDGKIIWRMRPDNHVATDPLLVRGRLVALVVTASDRDVLRVSLAAFDPKTGAVQSRTPIAQLRNEWNWQPPAHLVSDDRNLIAMIGGAVICCDSLGNPRWTRRLPWMHPEVDGTWHRQSPTAPIVRGETILIGSPEVKSAIAIDLRTGGERWSVPLPTLSRFVGCSKTHAVYLTDTQAVGIDIETGNIGWRSEQTDALEASAISATELFLPRSWNKNKAGGAELQWIDPATGRARFVSSVGNEKTRTELLVGPVIPFKGRLWLLIGQNGRSTTRDIYRFERVADAETLTERNITSEPIPARWRPRIMPATEIDTQTVLPGWTLGTPQSFQSKYSWAEFQAEKDGEQNVLRTRVGRDNPIRWLRVFTIPKEAKTLSVRLRVEKDDEFELGLSLGTETVRVQKIEQAGWTTVSFDVAPFAGRSLGATLTLQQPDGRGTSEVFWKSVRIEPQMTTE